MSHELAPARSLARNCGTANNNDSVAGGVWETRHSREKRVDDEPKKSAPNL
jgi:hypothetical protein